ncbi:MAG: hypothetical protein R6W95_17455 [Desulfosarcina sp.]
MTPIDALIELLGRVGASQGSAVLVNDEELRQWPGEAVAAMKAQRLIAKARPTSSAICPGCEHECVMPVHTLPDAAGAPVSFIVCDKRSDINRVTVSTELLTQWQCSAKSVDGFIADCLELRLRDKERASDGLWEIGIVRGNKRRQMLGLQANGVLNLVAGDQTEPLAELIEYQDGAYFLDSAMIRQMVDAATTADDRYISSNAKREVRKLKTQSIYADWHKAYRDLKKKHPNRSDVWYSKKIAKMDIALCRKAETVRKQMKK